MRSSPFARVRLVCIPYAGGGPSSYAPWVRLLPEWIELRVLAPPGREHRYEEAPVRMMEDYLAPVVAEILADDSLPIAVFGHSMGAVVGYELTQRLTRAGHPPTHLFLSGRAFPSDLPASSPLHLQSDADLLRTIRTVYGGLPEELDEIPELLQKAQDLIRADLEVLERFQPDFSQVLDLPVTLLWAEGDPSAPASAMLDWKRITRAETAFHIFPGTHFYLLENPAEVVAVIVQRLASGAGL